MTLHLKAVGERYQHWNTSGVADGMVGGVYPTAIYYIPVNHTGFNGSRYWTYLNVPYADTGSSREQSTWMRFQQIECAGPNKGPPCKLIDWPMYWDTMWFARFPGANKSDTYHQSLITGSFNYSQPSGFYTALLEQRRFWDAELAAEGMMSLSLPSPSSTNGTYLKTQAVHSIVRSMITRQQKWHPRYGTRPGYGSDALHGLPDVFTSTVTAALEMGAMPYAKGVIDNQFKFYVRADGMMNQKGMALPASARVLTLLALYFSYSGGDNEAQALLLQHFDKAEALANWLLSRRCVACSY